MVVERLQVALEPTSQSILTDTTKIKTDVANINTAVPKINTIDTNLGIPSTPQSNLISANVHSKLNWLLSNLNTVLGKTGIKSIQRGRVSSYIGNPGYTPITISFVYPSKSFLIAHGHVQARSDSGTLYEYDAADIAVISDSGTRIDFPALDNRKEISIVCNWQVIEFY